jgi:hypothetical protein
MYALNRFIAAGLMTIPAFKPRYMLAAYLGLCFIFGLAATTTKGHTSVAMLILVLCFESVRDHPQLSPITQLTPTYRLASPQSSLSPSAALADTPKLEVQCLSPQFLVALQFHL